MRPRRSDARRRAGLRPAPRRRVTDPPDLPHHLPRAPAGGRGRSPRASAFHSLLLLLLALAALPGCSCSRAPEPEKIVKRAVRRAAESLPSPLQVFLDERKSLQAARHDGEVAKLIEARTIDPKTLEKVGGDVEMHEFLKNGVALFGEGKFDQALAEFERVARDYPNDKGLLVVAEKNMSIACLKLGRYDDYLTHVHRYAELLTAYLDETDPAEIREAEGE